ncbi:MAG: aminopeptidase P family protein [Oscillospiraceae bacterium]|nr:aminopeptidase P family protein [Oscillospiraceae bacterium]
MKRLLELRKLMSERNISAYIVCTDDFHGSEYVGGYFKLREYLSGFTGSAGTLAVTLDNAALWTDGRYYIQAENELSGSRIKLMKSGEKGTPSIEEFLAEKLPDGAVIGFDGRAVSAGFAEKLLKALASKGITARSDEDLGGMVWDKLGGRPGLSCEPVFELPESVCGFSASQKIEKIREKLKKERAECLAISALDQIAWILNLRGNDIEFNPVFLSYMIISTDEVLLFANEKIFPGNIAGKLEKNGVKILGYNDIYNDEIWHYKTVWLDSGEVNFRLKNTVRDHCEIIDKKSPVSLMKAIKNPAEIKAVKAAHLLDGIAVTRFMYWLKHSVGKERITEISAAEKLEEFRRMSADHFGESFAPIMAYGEHGAIVHYSATEETDAELQPRGMLLSDTGGHYLGENAAGTTDITRTFVLGELTETERKAFTIVLASHLELLRAIFPKGVRGSVLDGIAHRPMWQCGMDFNHGTGHGVGFMLNVHEGPQRISWRAAGDAPLEEGMITSDEPGYYVEGKFGIRHESLLLCWRSYMSGFLHFIPLTLVPFDRDGIDPELLTAEQRGYLNDYHAMVFDKISPYLPTEEAEWLKKITEPI